MRTCLRMLRDTYRLHRPTSVLFVGPSKFSRWYNFGMDLATPAQSRRQRFRRAAEPLSFQITDGDLAIVRAIALHRFLRSTQIARIVGRSLDRTNRRLQFLFHAGYIDRPRAQLDRFSVDGSSHMVYALADAGARLLKEYDGQIVPRGERSSNNRSAMRPFIEHQLVITEFHVALHDATRKAMGIEAITCDELVSAFPAAAKARRNPLKISASIVLDGHRRDVAVIPDALAGLRFADGSRRCFAVEIDRGTMPVTRTDPNETSFALKMRAYLAAHAAGLHQQYFGWKAFRVLTVTTDDRRIQSMIEALRKMPMPGGLGAALFFFTTQHRLCTADPLREIWRNGNGRAVALV
jgi:hypothetical protein